MSFKKLIKNAVQVQQDNRLTAFALLAGLAAGAATALLFAPKTYGLA